MPDKLKNKSTKEIVSCNEALHRKILKKNAISNLKIDNSQSHTQQLNKYGNQSETLKLLNEKPSYQ